jgi:hypothetical protein
MQRADSREGDIDGAEAVANQRRAIDVERCALGLGDRGKRNPVAEELAAGLEKTGRWHGRLTRRANAG